MEEAAEKSMVERIIELCKMKKIPVSRLEKDLGYGNGYLNPKKIKDVKMTRLIEILDYLAVSPEEFWDIGSPQTQATETLLVQLKHVNPELYESIMGKEKPAANSDGLTEAQREFNEVYPLMTDQEVSVLLSTAKALIASRKDPGDS